MPPDLNRYRNRYWDRDQRIAGTSFDSDSDPDCDSDPGIGYSHI
jgi:hypothetical protein